MITACKLFLYCQTRFNPVNSGDIFRRLQKVNGNCIAIVLSVKLPLIRNLLSVNNINNKLIKGLQIAFTADNSFPICFLISGSIAILKTIIIIQQSLFHCIIRIYSYPVPMLFTLTFSIPKITHVPRGQRISGPVRGGCKVKSVVEGA